LKSKKNFNRPPKPSTETKALVTKPEYKLRRENLAFFLAPKFKEATGKNSKGGKSKEENNAQEVG